METYHTQQYDMHKNGLGKKAAKGETSQTVTIQHNIQKP